MSKPGKTGSGLALALNLDPSGISQMRRGDREIRVAELHIIADYLEESLPREIAGRLASDGSAREMVRVEAVIAPDVWRGTRVINDERVPPWPHERLAGVRQYACRIENEPGKYAICATFEEMRTRPWNNDHVHVRRKKGVQHEDTLRLARVLGTQIRLQLENASPDDRDAYIDYPTEDSDLLVEIRGLVVAFYTVLPF